MAITIEVLDTTDGNSYVIHEGLEHLPRIGERIELATGDSKHPLLTGVVEGALWHLGQSPAHLTLEVGPVTGRSTSPASRALHAWRARFRNKLEQRLGGLISIRLHNRILTAAAVEETHITAHGEFSIEPRLSHDYIFMQDGRLLEFDEWIKAVRSNPGRLVGARGLGEHMTQELLKAISQVMDESVQ